MHTSWLSAAPQRFVTVQTAFASSPASKYRSARYYPSTPSAGPMPPRANSQRRSGDGYNWRNLTMLNKDPMTSIFTFERKAKAAFVPAPEPHYPFADAWKEFDSLQNGVQGRGILGVARHATGIFLLLLGLIEFHPSTRFKYMIGTVLGAVLIAEISYTLVMRKRFQHWPCPRCHSEWPGHKNEKDSQCRVFGLRLQQLSHPRNGKPLLYSQYVALSRP